MQIRAKAVAFFLAVFIANLASALAQAPTPLVIYRTGFEFSEGYRTTSNLAGQNNWIAAGSGGNGIVTNQFAGEGQQAYIGFAPPISPDTYVTLFRPLNFDPVASGLPIVHFSVLMHVVDSSATTNRDEFRWSIYNTNGTRLLTVDFDNASQRISYLLEGASAFVDTGFSFNNSGAYQFEIILNFQRNRWSALLSQTEIISLQPITTTATPLSLGDIDAVYYVRDPAHPGDNYMLFDNYTVTAEGIANTAPFLQPTLFNADGQLGFRTFVEPLVRYSVESSADLRAWNKLTDHIAPDASFDFLDTTTSFADRARFYRVRSVTP